MDELLKNWIEIDITLGTSPGKVKDTLKRLGIGDNKRKILYQTCHLICREGRYFIVHFKELFYVVGKEVNWVEGDLERRNKIIKMLAEWGLVEIVHPEIMYSSYDIDIFLDDEIKVFKIGKKFEEEWDLRKMFNTDILCQYDITA